jgi:hypothetical protein
MGLPSKLADLTQAHLEELVTERAEEGPHLEFKRELPGNDREAKGEFLGDVTAFANAGGGDLVFGIAEDAEGVATAVTPLPGNRDHEALRLQSFIADLVEPKMPGVQVQSTPVAVGGQQGFTVVIRVPQSWAGPHRVETNRHFYVREGRRKRPLDVPEIRRLFLHSERAAEQIRDFRTERLGKLLAGEAPHKLVDGALLVVHLVPTQAALGNVAIDPVPYDGVPAQPIPVLGSRVALNKLNFDGALAIRNANAEGTHGYTQIFRNGFMEGVYVISAPDGQRPDGRAPLHTGSFELNVRAFFDNARTEYRRLGVSLEIAVLLSILRGKQVRLGHDPRFHFRLEAGQGLFDRDTLAFPEVLTQGDTPGDIALRPVFDLVWQAAGVAQCPYYDEDGRLTIRP